MKKFVSYVISIVILCLCVGCNGVIKKIIDLKPKDVTNIEIYDIPVPAAAKRKIVTDENDIKTVIDTLSAVRIKGDGASAEPVTGGVIQFVLNKNDGSNFIISYNGFSIFSSNDDWYEVSKNNGVSDLWNKMNYAEQNVKEYELPLFPKNDVPILNLKYTARDDIYNTNALRGTSSWSFDNGDGTATNITSDSMHPLDSSDYMPKIIIADDTDAIEMIFSLPPSSYTVRCWNDKYINDQQAYEMYYEAVDVNNNTIALSNDTEGYVYEIHAIWPQGDAYYSFYVIRE